MEINHISKIKESDPLRVYTTRIVRRHFLRKFCDSDHPVLNIETDLISMAKSKLQEYIISMLTPILPEFRTTIDKYVKDLASEKTMHLDLDDEDKMEIISLIMGENFEDLIPIIH
jgi:hypothetical protein